MINQAPRWCVSTPRVSRCLLSRSFCCTLWFTQWTLASLHLACRASLFGRGCNWNIPLLFFASCGHLSSKLLVLRSIFLTVYDSVPTSNVCHAANNTHFFSLLYESYILFLLLFPQSFFRGNIIGIPQSFMMDMHSSIVVAVKLETLITQTWHYLFTFSSDCVLFGG